ncbi:MAG: diguanylate cyclase [Solirubrobacteraceae bacterium]|nr:diguanylate cyclase [Solirubrobacteraceae bacterium]
MPAPPSSPHRLAVVLAGRSFRIAGAVLLVANLTVAVLGLRWELFPGRLSGTCFTCGLMIVPVLACFGRALLGGPRRAGAAWLGVAMVAYGIGNLIYVGWTQFDPNPPVPSLADVAYLAFYPAAGAAVFCLLSRDGGSASAGRLWLDGALGAAGAATVLAMVLSPALVSSGKAGAVVVGAGFAVGDLLLIGMVFGALAVRGVRGDSMWQWLGVGLTTFCVADVAYALQVAAGTFVVGTLWSGLWMAGLTVAAFAIWCPERPQPRETGRSAAMLAIPTLATIAAVVALVVSSFEQLPTIVIALATVTLGLAVTRTLVAFRQVRRLSDAHRQAVTDELTGLGNRRALFEVGERRLATKQLDRVALVLLDLDDFKTVNDTLGHHAGDELLRETGRRLALNIRHGDVLVRLGGDEFALLLRLGPHQEPLRLAGLILERIGLPVLIEGARLRVEASAGVAEGCDGQISVAELLRRADVAMYAAKANGSRVERYDPGLDEANRTRLQTIRDLDTAIARDEFVLHYQPKIDLSTGRIAGAEALVRWQHPTRGLLQPDTFLPLVEQSGRMEAVRWLVLKAAVEQIAAWRATATTARVAVNLSASDLLDEHLADGLLQLLREHGVPAEALELEITESVLMTDPARARAVLERLRGLGLRIAVDDYGTGYCSLAYLRDLPIDELKIDRTFITHMSTDERSAAIVRSTIELAHALDLEVVAEGVEHLRDGEALAAFGCDFAQGYHFSRPLSAAAFAEYAAYHSRDTRLTSSV